jgi:hypothetical protein
MTDDPPPIEDVDEFEASLAALLDEVVEHTDPAGAYDVVFDDAAALDRVEVHITSVETE